MSGDDLISVVVVCDACGFEACWNGDLMCEGARTAGTVEVPPAVPSPHRSPGDHRDRQHRRARALLADAEEAIARVEARCEETYGHHGPVDAFITRVRAALHGEER